MSAQASFDSNRAEPMGDGPRRRSSMSVPHVLSSFVGRERELAALREMIRDPAHRIITVTGPGGVGKTRLAIEVASAVESELGSNVWWVALASLGSSALLPAAIARSLGVRESGTRSIVRDIIEFLMHRRALLLIDNFERVLDAGGVISEILAACPDLSVLVTSQAPLRLSGEWDFSLTPLASEMSQGAEVDPGGRDPAIQLFVDRARAARSTFALTDENRAAVESICRELDGLPLAIELAAAWVRVLSPAAIASRLQSDRQTRFLLLSGGPRDMPERHQSISEAIGWSYRLLDDDEQRLFRRLSVFRGGFTLDAAEQVCARIDSGAAAVETFDLVASLVDKSLLLNRDFGNGEPNFLMLASVRAYAAEQLGLAGESETLDRQQAEFFLSFAETAAAGLRGGEQRAWLERLDADHANLLAALHWLDATGDGARLQRLVWALFWYWFYRGNTQEARHWLERACAYDEGATVTDLWVRVGDVMLTNHVGAHEEALRRAIAVAALARERGEPIMESMALTIAQYGALALGMLEESRSMGWEAHRIMEHVDDDYWRAMVFGEAGLFLGGAGETSDGLAMVEAGLALDRARGDQYFAGIRLSDIGVMRHDRGELDMALARYGESIAALSGVGGVWYLSSPFGGIAALVAESNPVEAAQLLGAARALQDRGGANPWATETDRNALALERSRTALGDAEFERAFRAGYEMPVDQVVTIARSLAEPRAVAAAVWAPLSPDLSPRELEVLELLAGGMSDREIGLALSISPRTASKHVANIFAKLGVSNRAEAAAVTRGYTGSGESRPPSTR